MKRKILFIHREQFGSLTDTLKYCEYLNSKYEIEYLCFDKKRPRICIPNVKIIYVPYKGSKFVNGMLFIIAAIIKCIFFNGFIFIIYFPQCSLIKRVLFWRKMHIDIRTLSISKDEKLRHNENFKLNNEINYFDSVSLITEGIKNKIQIKNRKQFFILPLGADIISDKSKKFDSLKLLYIGTLCNRDIIKTIIGLELFIQKYPQISIQYDIVGDGDEYSDICTYVKRHKLEEYIHLHGRIPYYSLNTFLDVNNIGVSFVPITDYYEFQPPTKTYEYVLSGLYCIATNTFSNRKIINKENGILIDDTADSFSNALYDIYLKMSLLNSEDIRKTMLDYKWDNIVNTYLIPIIK